MQLLVAALLATMALAEPVPGRVVTLDVPRPLTAGEVLWLQVTLGAVSRGTEAVVLTPKGRLLGVVSPFGIRSNTSAGTYSVPLPPDLISDGRVSLRIAIDSSGHPRRAPTADEVTKVELRIGPPER